jgi:hypothetical protein
MKNARFVKHTIIRKQAIERKASEKWSGGIHTEQLVQVSAFQFLNLISDQGTLNILFDNVRMPDLGYTHNPLFVIQARPCWKNRISSN